MAELLVIGALAGAALALAAVRIRGLLRGQDRRATRPCERCAGVGRVRRLGHLQASRCPICSGRGRTPRQDGAWL